MDGYLRYWKVIKFESDVACAKRCRGGRSEFEASELVRLKVFLHGEVDREYVVNLNYCKYLQICTL